AGQGEGSTIAGGGKRLRGAGAAHPDNVAGSAGRSRAQTARRPAAGGGRTGFAKLRVAPAFAVVAQRIARPGGGRFLLELAEQGGLQPRREAARRRQRPDG